MYTVEKTTEGERVVVKVTSSLKEAQGLVKELASSPGGASGRPTALEVETGLTVAGCGCLGLPNGKTARRKASK